MNKQSNVFGDMIGVKPPVQPKILYRCDRRACVRCDDYCHHTSDINHAENFQIDCSGIFVQVKEGGF